MQNKQQVLEYSNTCCFSENFLIGRTLSQVLFFCAQRRFPCLRSHQRPTFRAHQAQPLPTRAPAITSLG